MPPAGTVPLPMVKSLESLEDLRQDVDRVDNAIHDLLMERAELVGRIGRLKRDGNAGILRPDREALLLRRLMSRHKGSFPKPALVRLWREIIAAPLHVQGPFSVAVYCPPDEPGFWDLARDQYGAHTPMTALQSSHSVLRAVMEKDATVGILPLPSQDDATPWWPHLMVADDDAPQVVLRLPIAGNGNGRGEDLEALAIAAIRPGPTGDDRSYLAFETADEMSRSRLTDTLEDSGLTPRFFAAVHEATPNDQPTWRYLVEVADYVTDGDERIEAFRERIAQPAIRVQCIGHYAAPFEPAQLADTD